MLANGLELDSKKLAIRYSVTVQTIRRDLNLLEQQGYAQCTCGGAVASKPILTFSSERKLQAEAVRRGFADFIPDEHDNLIFTWRQAEKKP